MFTFHNDQPRLSPVIDSYRVFRGMWQASKYLLKLDYPVNLINSSINEFLHNIDNISAPDEASDGTFNIVVPLPFKDQKSANLVKREMQNPSAKIGVVYLSHDG